MEWWNSGMAEYSTTQNALLYETKVAQKIELQWNEKMIYNYLANQSWKKASLIIIGAKG